MALKRASENGEHGEYIGATAILHLEVLPSATRGLYRAAVYDWFDRKPLYISGSDSSLPDAKADASARPNTTPV
jgi:hypothetical protein